MITYLGVGGNLGDEDELLTRFRAAARGLGHLGQVTSSGIYRTAPVGPVENQPNFLNAVFRLECDAPVPPLVLLGHLHSIESRLGRVRAAELRNGPRAIDLDVLLIGDLMREDPRLTIPSTCTRLPHVRQRVKRHYVIMEHNLHNNSNK